MSTTETKSADPKKTLEAQRQASLPDSIRHVGLGLVPVLPLYDYDTKFKYLAFEMDEVEIEIEKPAPDTLVKSMEGVKESMEKLSDALDEIDLILKKKVNKEELTEDENKKFEDYPLDKDEKDALIKDAEKKIRNAEEEAKKDDDKEEFSFTLEQALDGSKHKMMRLVMKEIEIPIIRETLLTEPDVDPFNAASLMLAEKSVNAVILEARNNYDKLKNDGNTSVIAEFKLDADLKDISDVKLKQRKIITKSLMAGNMIASHGRRGPATFIIMSRVMFEKLFAEPSYKKYQRVPLMNSKDVLKDIFFDGEKIGGMNVHLSDLVTDNEVVVGRYNLEEPGIKMFARDISASHLKFTKDMLDVNGIEIGYNLMRIGADEFLPYVKVNITNWK